MSKAWKDLERRVCRALGAERRPSVGAGGWARGSDDDGSAPFAVEVKYTKRPALYATWLTQARNNARATGRPWLIAIGTHNSPRIVAVLDFYELVALLTEAGRIRPTQPKGVTVSNIPDTPPADEPAPGPVPAPEPQPDDDGDEDEDTPPEST